MKPEKAHYVVATAIVVKDRKFLIVKRASHEKVHPGRWTVPGGKLERNDYENSNPTVKGDKAWYGVIETLIKREVKEETNLEVNNITYLVDIAFIRPDNIPVVVLSYYCFYESGEVSISKDFTDYKWVSIGEAKNFDLIEGIYEEIEMVDDIINNRKPKRWY